MLWKFITWIRSSFEDNTKESSHKRLTIFAFVIASLGAFLFTKIDNSFMLHAYYANLTLIAVMMGWVTIPQIVEIFKAKNNVNQNESNTKSTDTTTTSDDFSNVPQL
jgi:hypothetical protein